MTRSEPHGRWAAALAAVLAAAALPRLACLRTEPWLDEIWSLDLARTAATAADVFFKLHDDNNNPLSTLYLHFVSSSRDWTVYRYLSLCAGLAAVALLGWDPEDRPRGLLAGLLAAVSTHMVLYSTEARGYALMSLFSLSAFLLLRARTPLTRPRAAAFGLCVLGGFLSHPTFVYVYAALVLCAAAKNARAGRVRGLLELFGPATLAFGAYEVLQFPLRVDGANRLGFWSVVLGTLDLWSGAPTLGAAAFAGAAAVLGLLGWELWNIRRERPDEFVFFAALFAGAFAFVAIFPFPFERHFYGCLPFGLMLLAGALTRLARRGGAPRAAAACLAGLFLLGNGARVRALAIEGRGHYLEAVRRMAADTPGGEIVVGSDHDVRNRMVLEFYAAYLTPPKRIEYVTKARWQERTPDWFILHSFTADRLTAPIGVTIGAAHYAFVDLYPYAGLSGWTWMLYRRDPAQGAPQTRR